VSNIKIRPVTIVLLVVALVLIFVGFVYLTTAAASLPAFFPGHAAHSTHHHVKHALAAFILAIAALIGAWLTTSPERTSS
jgi:divalent metal cation (Fe/Co/Zn/Cd) transporter